MKAPLVTTPTLRPALLLAPLLALSLTACDRQGGDATPDAEPRATPIAEPSQSIIREGFDEPEGLTILEPLDIAIGFPNGGAELDEAALQALQGVLDSVQLAEGWPITLRAHSDSGGDDEVNMRMTESRGQAVANWLIENGVSDDRITIIEFGEQNPVEPNANPDGTPNEAGRAANRRVEVEIADPSAEEDDEPTLTSDPEETDAADE